MKRVFWVLVMLAGAASADFLDEFNSSVLDPRWGIGWEDPTHWSLTARPGFLRIITKYCEGDTMWNSFYHVEAIPGNFEVSTKLIARPDSAGQVAGVYADYDSLFIGRPRAAAGVVNISPYGKMVFGMINDSLYGLPYSDTLVYLRIRTSGNTAFAEYSPNNSNWTVLSLGGPFPGHQVSGVMAMISSEFGGTRQTPEISADFDWFHLVAVTGIEEENQIPNIKNQKVRIMPNPFASFAAALGHEREDFAVYDIAGNRVGIYRGDRIGLGLAAGVYFVQSQTGLSAPQRIVKIR